MSQTAKTSLSLQSDNKRWTKEQLAAIHHPANPIRPALVSAAAGSGKTAVLVERVIQLLVGEDGSVPVRANRIALVTYTKKAASEMKTRLEKALIVQIDELSDSSDKSSQIKIFREQLVLLEAAKITTINAFCLNLLKENAAAMGLSVGVKIASDETLKIFSNRAMEQVLEVFYELSPEDEIKQTLAFFGSKGDRELKTAILAMHTALEKLIDRDKWLSRQLWLYSNPKEYLSTIMNEYSDLLDIDKAVTLTESSLELAVGEKANALLQSDLVFFADWENAGDFPHASQSFKGEDEEIKLNRDKVKEIAKAVKEATILINDFSNAITQLSPIVKTFVKLVRLYSEKFLQIKQSYGMLDFSDTEHMCVELLRNSHSKDSGVMENEYDLIIIDEFQDINFLQYELFRLLDNKRNRLFMVGDLKQSIYKFRGGEPAIFKAVSDDPDYEVLYLSKNFRSSVQVLNAVNAIFANVMPDYDEKAKLNPPELIADHTEFEAEFCLLDEESFPGKCIEEISEQFEGTPPDDEFSGLKAEAEYTALRIKEMCDSGFEIAFKSDGKIKFRPCNYGDFAVLSRTKQSTFTFYEEAFARHSIPCVSECGKNYLKTEEVGLALDFLKIINNPYSDLSLFNVMYSPLYGFTAEELANIRLCRQQPNNDNIPLYSSLLEAERSNKTTERLPHDKITAFLKTIAHYRRIADVTSAAELIAIINGKGEFLPLMLNRHKQANIRLLSYYAEQFSTTYTDLSLSAFLAYIEELKNSKIDVKQANVSAGLHGCVRMLTIHKSKGLEFPICFIAGTNRDYFKNGKTATPLLSFYKEVGIIGNYFNADSFCRTKTLLSDYAKRLKRKQEREEEMRKLYVAATRAESKLIFTGYASEGKPNSIRENSYAAWLDGTIRRVEPLLTTPELKATDLPKTIDSNELVNDIVKTLKSEYPREVLRHIPRKLSATQVGVVSHVHETADEYDEPMVFPRNPSFYATVGEKRLSGKKRGDAYHKMLELLDFQAGDYENQMQDFKQRFTPQEFKAVNPKDICGFFDSELGRRVIRSSKIVKEYKLYTTVELADIGALGELCAFCKMEVAIHEKPFVQGIADMFFYEDGEIVLVDYKTNRNTTIERLKEDYSTQLEIYKKAIEEMTGVRVKECWIYSFERGMILC
ncbi:MAG: UvrD-helicase domain-containing protein [Oscillospiraceae bacterium]|nr:UvrD-helicase domain-containing protein [Oscillospiraceae bacterium]